MRGYVAVFVVVLAPAMALAQREFGFDNRKPSGQPYLTAEETVRRFKVAPEFEAKLFAGEPQVVNPIAFTVDERGRVWVVECFEYPKRTPKGKMPRDRIVILEDTDGDGVCDQRTIFAEGKDFPHSFDLASGIEVGYGGVFLGAPPYLWFIENKNDKAGKFEILLKGFGSQDTHETLNTFQWGPDGWLYGLHGVFTHSEVEAGAAATGRDKPDAANPSSKTKMNAAVWRFHPRARTFEIFAEGTSNPWGMDWRNTDGEFILCCCVIPHLYHMVPGGIYRRQAGASFHPHAYGEIKEICDHTFHRESGWAHAGLLSLDVPHVPEKYRNSVIFGSIHGSSIKQNILKKNGSTFVASRGEDFLVSGDKNFRPINMKWGPNGDILLIDWHDQNPCHQTPPDNWDYERGRVYRIQRKGAKLHPPEDLAKKSEIDLARIALHDDNPWRNRTALRLLREKTTDPNLKSQGLNKAREAFAALGPARDWSKLSPAAKLRLTWAIDATLHDKAVFTAYTEAGQSDAVLVSIIRLISEWMRRPDLQPYQPEQALKEFGDFVDSNAPEVRRELASAAFRLAGSQDVRPLLHRLMQSSRDVGDPVIPHLIWLAYEKVLSAAKNEVLDAELSWLAEEATPKALTPDKVVVRLLVTDYIVPRVMRRLAATGRPEQLARCIHFLEKLTDDQSGARRKALEGLTLAVQGKLVDAPPHWPRLRAQLLAQNNNAVSDLVHKLSVSFRDPEAVRRALAAIADGSLTADARIDAARALALLRPTEGESALVQLVGADAPLPVRVEAARALAAYDNPDLAKRLVAGWDKHPPLLRSEIVSLLSGRREWARMLLTAVAERRIPRTELTDNHILRIRSFKDRALDDQIQKVWGKFRDTPADLAKLIDKMRNSLYEGDASFARGKRAFDNLCAKCHKFDGKGADVGPPLDGAGRDIEYLLANIIDPNRVIGAPYFIRVIELKNGRNEIGLLAAEDEQTITLKAENGAAKIIPRKEIESIVVQEKSLMPEGLDKNLTPQAFRDVIRYVMAHPFVTHVSVDGKPIRVGPPGRIPLPAAKDGAAVVVAEVSAPAPMKTTLLIGGMARAVVKLNDAVVFQGRLGGMQPDQPDQTAVDVTLQKGRNVLSIEASYQGSAALFARFLDPERKLQHPDFE